MAPLQIFYSDIEYEIEFNKAFKNEGSLGIKWVKGFTNELNVFLIWNYT